MKLPCEMIQDLLPLYEEGLCSPASCAAVEAHLQECPDCRALAENIQKLEEPLLPVQTSAEDQAVAKSFRKVHRRWRASLIAMLLVVPMLLLTINQVRSEGISFTNIDDILLVWKYVQALERGDFEKAADYMNYEALHEHMKGVLIMDPDTYAITYPELEEEDWAYYYAKKEALDAAKAMSLEEFTDIVRTKYLKKLEEFKEMGYSIENTSYKGSRFTSGNGFWQIHFEVLVANNEGRFPVTVNISVLDGKILGAGSMSHNTDLDPSVDLFDVFDLRYSEY